MSYLAAVASKTGAASAPSTPAPGPEDEPQVADRFTFALFSLVGQVVSVLVADGAWYEGIFHTGSSEDAGLGLVLKMATLKRPPRKGPAPVIAPGATVVIKPEDLVQLCAKDAEFDDTNDTSGQAVQGIGTDTAISKTKLGTLVNRKLEKADAWVSPNAAVGGLEEMSRGRGKSGQWDQFEANRRLFNVESSFDEDQYTTPLNRREFSRADQVRAERLEREILNKSSRNAHVMEERGKAVRSNMSEEERYSSVMRKPSDGSYVPPMMRRGSKGSPSARSAPRRGSPRAVSRSTSGGSTSDATSSPTRKSVPSSSPPEEAPTASASASASASSTTTAAATAAPGTSASTAATAASNTAASAPAPSATTTTTTTAAAATATATATATTGAAGVAKKEEGGAAATKKGAATTKPLKLNPNAKEFKLSATAKAFVPKAKLAAPAAVVAPAPGGGGAGMPRGMYMPGPMVPMAAGMARGMMLPRGHVMMPMYMARGFPPHMVPAGPFPPRGMPMMARPPFMPNQPRGGYARPMAPTHHMVPGVPPRGRRKPGKSGGHKGGRGPTPQNAYRGNPNFPAVRAGMPPRSQQQQQQQQ